jgi:hypothetical protein
MACPQAHHFPGEIHFGYATGHCSTNRWDSFAPDPGLPFVVEVEALTKHLVFFGTSGQGKTDALIKPTVYQYLRAKMGGAFYICGKGALAAEFLGLKNYLCLDPTRHTVGLLEGLTPHQAVQTITEINIRPGDNPNENPIWNNLTIAHLRHAAYFLYALVEMSRKNPNRSWFWTMWDWNRLAFMPQTDPQTLKDIVAITKANHPGAADGMLLQALNYFETDFYQMDDKLREGSMGQVSTWMGGITSHPLLIKWAQCETGSANPEICLRKDENGEFWSVGMNLPKVRYDKAGQLATAFVKSRIYTRIKERADMEGGWREADPNACMVLMVQDEFQLIATESDYDLAPVARSLGCALVIATQTLESVREKARDPNQVEAFFDAFQSRIALSTSIGTVEWLQKWNGWGTAWIPQFGGGGRTLNFIGGVQTALATPLFDESHPMRVWFQRLQRKGVGEFKAVGMDAVQSQQPGAVKNFIHDTLPSNLRGFLGFEPAQGSASGKAWEQEPIVRVADFASLTKKQGIALCSVLRGGVPRRDFVELNKPIKGIPEDLRDPNYKPRNQVEPEPQKLAA